MDRFGEQLFSRAALSLEQNRRFAARHCPRDRFGLEQRSAVAGNRRKSIPCICGRDPARHLDDFLRIVERNDPLLDLVAKLNRADGEQKRFGFSANRKHHLLGRGLRAIGQANGGNPFCRLTVVCIELQILPRPLIRFDDTVFLIDQKHCLVHFIHDDTQLFGNELLPGVHDVLFELDRNQLGHFLQKAENRLDIGEQPLPLFVVKSKQPDHAYALPIQPDRTAYFPRLRTASIMRARAAFFILPRSGNHDRLAIDKRRPVNMIFACHRAQHAGFGFARPCNSQKIAVGNLYFHSQHGGDCLGDFLHALLNLPQGHRLVPPLLVFFSL